MRTIKKFWNMKPSASNPSAGEIYIYSEISSEQFWGDETTATTFKEDLEAMGDLQTLNIYINSPGGSVFEGNSIYNIIKRHKAHVNVHIDGVAASIASVIAMAGDTIFMPKNAMMMIHNPWVMTAGNASELRKQADDMDRIRESLVEAYLAKSNGKIERSNLIELLDAETWLTATECVAYGLADVVEETQTMAACADTKLFAKYQNTPGKFLQPVDKQDEEPKLTDSERAFRKQLLADAEAQIAKFKNMEE
ncbi:head maturation protease, ClpP-related [Bacillus altitudinis]|uniref:ATP-dependent Clp protease proteolytic subunit n=1 Tax=Bacillus altitudinis TaxID=293387 RepID=A0ABV1S3T4_BACAB